MSVLVFTWIVKQYSKKKKIMCLDWRNKIPNEGLYSLELHSSHVYQGEARLKLKKVDSKLD